MFAFPEWYLLESIRNGPLSVIGIRLQEAKHSSVPWKQFIDQFVCFYFERFAQIVPPKSLLYYFLSVIFLFLFKSKLCQLEIVYQDWPEEPSHRRNVYVDRQKNTYSANPFQPIEN